MVEKAYFEGLEFVVGGRNHLPGGVAQVTQSAEDLWTSLVTGGWACPSLDEHLDHLRNLPANFPYSAAEVRPGVFEFRRR